MAAIYEKYGSHFLKRCFGEAESAALPPRPAAYLAGRFAAKEAAVKALGCGFAHGIGPRDIETLRSQSGAPFLRLHGPALAYATCRGIRKFHVSISHERACALALVIMEE